MELTFRWYGPKEEKITLQAETGPESPVPRHRGHAVRYPRR